MSHKILLLGCFICAVFGATFVYVSYIFDCLISLSVLASHINIHMFICRREGAISHYKFINIVSCDTEEYKVNEIEIEREIER